MKDQNDHDEQIKETPSIKFDSGIEELENREAPKLVANHNETMLRSDP